AGMREGVEPPQLRTGVRIVRADEAAIGTIAGASLQTFDHLAPGNDRTAGFGITLGAIGDRGFPHLLSVDGADRDKTGVGRGGDDLVAVDRDVAHRSESDRLERT